MTRCSIFSTIILTRLQASIGVTRSYSSCLFLCALTYKYIFIKKYGASYNYIKKPKPDQCPALPVPRQNFHINDISIYVHSIALMMECIFHNKLTLAFLSTAQGMKELAVKSALYSWTSRQNSRQCRKVWWQPEMSSNLSVPVFCLFVFVNSRELTVIDNCMHI